MIVPMKKVSLIIMGDKKSETLRKLRKLGILHVEIAEGSGKKLDELKEKVSLLETAAFTVTDKKKKKKIQAVDVDASEAFAVSEDILALTEEKKKLLDERTVLTAEIDRLAGWGEVDPDEIKALADKGYDISLYEVPESVYKSLDESVKTLCIGKTKSSVKFMVLTQIDDGEDKEPDSLKNFRFELPESSTAELKKRAGSINTDIEEIDKKLGSYVAYSDSIVKAVEACETDIEFETYATGMSDEALNENNVSVSYFTGYIEADNVEKLKAAAKENSWGLVIEDPTEEDNVPTKLKNNKFVSLIYPLTDFLGTVPG